MIIKPIATTYKHTEYRSRLEAQWAIFFDTLEETTAAVHAEYENPYIGRNVQPDVFGAENYVPDFRILIEKQATHNWFLEAKPTVPNRKYLEKMNRVSTSLGLQGIAFFVSIGSFRGDEWPWIILHPFIGCSPTLRLNDFVKQFTNRDWLPAAEAAKYHRFDLE